MSAPAVGIDLGTTNSVVAVSLGGKPQVLTDKAGGPLIPSVVAFPEGSVPLVGKAARARRALDPANTVYSVKRLLGRPFKSEECRRARSRMAFELKEGADSAIVVSTRGGEHTLPELSALILREVRRVAEESLGEKIDRCVVTVPANFNELQRSSTKVAGRIAELDVIRILNEPTAAALAYGYGRGTREKICIFDFGGGTFDVTLLELSGNVFEVLATAGDTFLGGDDIDIALTESLAEPFERATKVDITRDRLVFDMLRDAAEQAKIELSFKDRAELDFRSAGAKTLKFQKSLTREDLEAVAAPFVSRTFDVCAEALKLANLRPTDLTAVILVGGSTRIPAVRQRVSQFFGRDPLTNLPPEEVVGLGASILAEALTGGKRTRGATGANVRAPAAPASVPPSSVGVPGANAPSVIEDNRRPTLNQAPVPHSPKKSSPDTLRMGVGVGKNEPSQATKRPSVGTFDLDDPFAELSGPKNLPTAPQPAPGPASARRSQPSDLTWEPVKDVPGALGKLDEPSFMGRLPKGPEGPEVHVKPASEGSPGAAGASGPVPPVGSLSGLFDDPLPEGTPASVGASTQVSAPSFNLEDPSFVGKLPTTPAVAPRKEASSPGFSVDDPLAMPDPLASNTVRDPLASPTKGGRFGAPAFGQSLDDSSPADTSDLSMSFSMTADDIFGGGGSKGPAAAAVATALAAGAASALGRPPQRPQERTQERTQERPQERASEPPAPQAPPAPQQPSRPPGPPPVTARESGARPAPQPA
ncbi:MAG: Hsp70 family protein, partial [Deltaproteobacteria bacterium]|nr:Hsp70 family protein [Deltaproteobacteria bacterium]